MAQVHMTAKQARQYAALAAGKTVAAKPSAKKASVPSVPSERSVPGIPPEGARITHRLVKSLNNPVVRFDHPPVVNSLASCEKIGTRWQCYVYLECGAALFDLDEATFNAHFIADDGRGE